MLARDWFAYVREQVERLAKLEADAEEAHGRVLPKGQQYEPSAHAASVDGGTAMVRWIETTTDLDMQRTATEALLERASQVLYGRDGRGGLAKQRSSTDADCIMGYYCMGMSWREVADELVRPESDDARHWCMMRARRALEYMDRVGMDWLIGS